MAARRLGYYRIDLFDYVDGVELERRGKVLVNYLRIAIDFSIIQRMIKT